MNGLNERITDINDIQRHFVFREGFVFTSLTAPANVYDSIVLRYPETCDSSSPKFPCSKRTLEEHIALINRIKIKKAIIIAEDIGFIERCPDLQYLWVIPAKTSDNNFNYSPLYKLSHIKWLKCVTKYDGSSKHFEVDYSPFQSLEQLSIEGQGHNNYTNIETLQTLNISNNKTSTLCDFELVNLKSLSIQKSKLNSLTGIKDFRSLQELCLNYNRTLNDISELEYTASTLRALSICNCPKINDFSSLFSLRSLEHLVLIGNNVLPNLNFLYHLKQIKTFVFSMIIEDGDLTPCLSLPYASALKGKKKYNYKDEDLPKTLPTKPFELH